MELLEGIETRRSIRGFKSTPIPEEVMKGILKAASKSPSFTNTQPWEVAVVTGKKKEELSKILYDLGKSDASPNPGIPMPTSWPPELEARAREHGAKRFKALGIDRENEQQRKEMQLMNFEFYGAPCVLFLFMDSTLGSWSIFDTGLFAQSICLAAHAFGLGTCLQAQLARYPDAVREFLEIPETKQLVLGISIGYPDLEAKLNSYHSEKIGLDVFTKWYS
ncbi:nitroreductase [Chloroflexota bacterium]